MPQFVQPGNRGGKKITLINPPFNFSSKDKVILSECMGILSIAAALIEFGKHEVTVIDALFEGRSNTARLGDKWWRVGLSDRETLARIPGDTDLIGLSVPFSQMAPECHRLAGKIKAALPSVPLVMGGVHPSTQPELAISSAADYLVIGEGEFTLLRLLEYLDDRLRILPPGVVVADPVYGPESECSPTDVKGEYVDDLDVLPKPARHLLPFGDYCSASQRGGSRGRITASIITSRGCPYRCNFCSVHPVCGYKWRRRSPRLVLEEIDYLVEDYGVNHIEFDDDNFTIDKDRTLEILEGIVERNACPGSAQIYWSTPNGLRIDALDDGFMALASRSNCLSLTLALEHGDEEMLKLMNKRLDLSKAVEMVKLIRKYDIECYVFVIFGYPGETRERFENGLRFYSRLKEIAPAIRFHCLVAQPYPGTNLYKLCLEEGYLPAHSYSSIDSMFRFSAVDGFFIRTPDFDERELRRRKKVLHKTLVPRGERLREKLKSMIPDAVKPYVRGAYRASKSLIASRGKS